MYAFIGFPSAEAFVQAPLWCGVVALNEKYKWQNLKSPQVQMIIFRTISNVFQSCCGLHQRVAHPTALGVMVCYYLMKATAWLKYIEVVFKYGLVNYPCDLELNYLSFLKEKFTLASSNTVVLKFNQLHVILCWSVEIYFFSVPAYLQPALFCCAVSSDFLCVPECLFTNPESRCEPVAFSCRSMWTEGWRWWVFPVLKKQESYPLLKTLVPALRSAWHLPWFISPCDSHSIVTPILMSHIYIWFIIHCNKKKEYTTKHEMQDISPSLTHVT